MAGCTPKDSREGRLGRRGRGARTREPWETREAEGEKLKYYFTLFEKKCRGQQRGP